MPIKNNRKQSPKKRVHFKLEAPEAKDVVLCGTFNDRDTHSRHLKRVKKGIWRAYLALEPGACEYRFLVDERWRNDADRRGGAQSLWDTEHRAGCLLISKQ